MNWFTRKEHLPFRSGQIVINKTTLDLMIVNRKPYKAGSEWRMLIDDFNWTGDDKIVYYCKEVKCKEWRAVE